MIETPEGLKTPEALKTLETPEGLKTPEGLETLKTPKTPEALKTLDIQQHIQELPSELQQSIYQRTMELREPIKVLEPIQKLDIHTHSRFSDIIQHLKTHPSAHSYLNWFENSLLFELNDGRSLFQGFSPTMYKAFKGLDDDGIVFAIENEHSSIESQVRTLKHYWKHLSPGKRYKLWTSFGCFLKKIEK